MSDTAGCQTVDDQFDDPIGSKTVVSRESGRLGYRLIKRAFDIIFSILVLLLLSWLLIIVAIAIRIESKGPIIHVRTCVGKNNKQFRMYKFRSMLVDAEEIEKHLTTEQLEKYSIGEKLEDDPRVTPIGRIIRRLSIDELPQFLTVLLGDMSIVGPRPVVEREAQAYAGNRPELLSVKPGITGYWQVNGRSDCPFLSDAAMDMQLYYVRNRSIALDTLIFFRTIKVVFSTKGAR